MLQGLRCLYIYTKAERLSLLRETKFTTEYWEPDSGNAIRYIFKFIYFYLIKVTKINIIVEAIISMIYYKNSN